ncbi:hypothetical protein EV368DRAFT_30617 [Lentinula lateritia]|nr:hypothetical protein EV368DRAFT_30617 [Lentinula lateritia]
MSTLELIYDRKIYELWSWEPQQAVHQTARHQTARILPTRLTPRGNVRVAYLGPRDEEPDSLVVTKLARDNEVPALEREYRVYMDRLQHLQGSVVPICYGLYRGKVEGEKFACMLLEYYRHLMTYSIEERNFQIMRATWKLHEAGILHGSIDSMHHIVCSTTGVRIIDFSDVVDNHRCVGVIRGPHLSYPNELAPSKNGCPELVLVDKIYGPTDLLYRRP